MKRKSLNIVLYVEANYRQKRSSRGLSATAELLELTVGRGQTDGRTECNA